MKKTYIKPEIMFEEFSLSTNIAATCGTPATHSENQYGCGYAIGRFDQVVFTELMGCSVQEDDGDYNGICYHVPTEAYSLFSS